MGLFGSSSPAPEQPKLSADGAPIAPDRTKRTICWDARDDYFRCLDRHGIVDALAEGDKAKSVCAREGKRLDGDCAKSWVSVKWCTQHAFIPNPVRENPR